MVKPMVDKKKRWFIGVCIVLALFLDGCMSSSSVPPSSPIPTILPSLTPGVASPTPEPTPLPIPTLGTSLPDIPSFGVIYICEKLPVTNLCLARFPNGEVRHLTDLPMSSRVTDFIVSPDHRWALYIRQSDHSFAGELWRVNLGSGDNQPIPRHPPRAVNGLAWSPTGEIAYITSPPDAPTIPTDRDELWLLSVSGTQSKHIIPFNPDDTIGWRWPRWSRDGRFLFINRFLSGEATQLTEQSVLYALDVSTQRLQRVARGVRLLDQTQDGKQLLLISYRDHSSQLWVMDWPLADPPRLLTPEGQSDAHAYWSSDGGRILFASGKANIEGVSYQIWLMNADGGHRQALTRGPDALPQWLAGGGDRYVLFLKERSNVPPNELHLLDLQTKRSWSLGLFVSGNYTSIP